MCLAESGHDSETAGGSRGGNDHGCADWTKSDLMQLGQRNGQAHGRHTASHEEVGHDLCGAHGLQPRLLSLRIGRDELIAEGANEHEDHEPDDELRHQRLPAGHRLAAC